MFYQITATRQIIKCLEHLVESIMHAQVLPLHDLMGSSNLTEHHHVAVYVMWLITNGICKMQHEGVNVWPLVTDA